MFPFVMPRITTRLSSGHGCVSASEFQGKPPLLLLQPVDELPGAVVVDLGQVKKRQMRRP